MNTAGKVALFGLGGLVLIGGIVLLTRKKKTTGIQDLSTGATSAVSPTPGTTESPTPGTTEEEKKKKSAALWIGLGTAAAAAATALILNSKKKKEQKTGGQVSNSLTLNPYLI